MGRGGLGARLYRGDERVPVNSLGRRHGKCRVSGVYGVRGDVQLTRPRHVRRTDQECRALWAACFCALERLRGGTPTETLNSVPAVDSGVRCAGAAPVGTAEVGVWASAWARFCSLGATPGEAAMRADTVVIHMRQVGAGGCRDDD